MQLSDPDITSVTEGPDVTGVELLIDILEV